MTHSSAHSRSHVLDSARRAVLIERNADYGDPEDNFAHIADLWNAYIRQEIFEPYDVANMMNLSKIARSTTSPTHPDHWIDQAGYAACGYATAVHGYDNQDPGS